MALLGVDWQALYAFLGALGIVIGVGIALGVLQSRSIRNAKDAEAARQIALNALAKAETAAAALAEYKLQALRDFVGGKTIDEMENRVMQAINRLGDRFDRAFDRKTGD